ncbi:cysteine desulfurase [Candidatus Woesearchaeota archaeon]|nr:cysteine desulfurase [Candidatus Woesearchaeota archaeon]
MIYLDNAATTRCDQRVVDAMLPFFTDSYGNASSLHTFGKEARQAVERARKMIADKIHASPSEIIFTSGGTEANNLAIRGIVQGKKGHLICSAIEHPSVLETMKKLQQEGYALTIARCNNDGVIDLDHLEKSICKDTLLISVMHANNEVGSIQPIHEIAKIAKTQGIPFHTDVVQSFCKIPVDVRCGISLASISGHKIHGPKGVGALYVNQSSKLHGILSGGEQESGLRPGTLNVAGIVGLGKAVELGEDADVKRMRSLRNLLIDGILSKISGSALTCPQELLLPHIAPLLFKGIASDALLLHLDSRGIAASSGSACSSGKKGESHVLRALGIETKEQAAIRFSLSRETTEEDIKKTVAALWDVFRLCRKC